MVHSFIGANTIRKAIMIPTMTISTHMKVIIEKPTEFIMKFLPGRSVMRRAIFVTYFKNRENVISLYHNICRSAKCITKLFIWKI